jgi:hypothetical protein
MYAVTQIRPWTIRASVILLACAFIPAHAASLFGDPSCEDWARMDARKKTQWTNAFLAPLSLTYQGLKRTGPDQYNDDANGAERAVLSIDGFCRTHPEQGPADGAAAYLKSLVSP